MQRLAASSMGLPVRLGLRGSGLTIVRCPHQPISQPLRLVSSGTPSSSLASKWSRASTCSLVVNSSHGNLLSAAPAWSLSQNLESRRTFVRSQEYGHRIKDDPGKYSTLKNIWVAGLLVGFVVLIFDVEGIFMRYFPETGDWIIDHVFLPFQWWLRDITGVDKDKMMPRVDAAVWPFSSSKNDDVLVDDDLEVHEDNQQTMPADTKAAGKSVVGFRERKIIEYENRIRSFSTPDKIFRYFATIKIVDSTLVNSSSENADDDAAPSTGKDSAASVQILMTPDDFLRALTPGLRQPEGLGLDQFKRIEISTKKAMRDFIANETQKLDLEEKKKLTSSTPRLRKDSVFYKLSSFGLINFSDFLFLLTVLSVSRRHFEIAFRMFDLNGDGNVDYEEFEKVQNAILSQTAIGQKLSLRSYRGVSSALAKYFFGKDLKQKLTIEKFLDFQTKLQTEMLTLEFERHLPINKKRDERTDCISESAFAELVLNQIAESKRERMLKRIKKRYPNLKPDQAEEVETSKKKKKKQSKEELASRERGITLADYLSFFHFLQNIADLDMALTFFNMAGAGIDKETLKHAARTVAKEELRDHLVDVIFTLFDEDEDGSLSHREFISVMKERLRRGLNRPKDTRFFKLISQAFVNALPSGLF